MATQKDRVLGLLKTAGDRGVSAHDLVYREGITRGAAIVHDLRKNGGLTIETIDEGDGKLARYILHQPAPPPPPPLCACGHRQSGHLSKTYRCFEYGCDCMGYRVVGPLEARWRG